MPNEEQGPRPARVDNPVSPVKAEIGGYVRYSYDRNAAESILVRLETNTGAMLAQAWTNSSGWFKFNRVSCGFYVLAVDAIGYRPIRLPVEHSYESYETVLHLVPMETEGATDEASLRLRELQIPGKARKEYEKGLKALAKKKLNEAVTRFRKAIEIHPHYDEAYVQLGLAHFDQKQYAEAVRVLEKAIGTTPANARAHALLGLVYRQQGQNEKALRALAEAVGRDPNAWVARLELGRTLLLTGQADKAYPHAERAHELNPQAASTHLLLYNLQVLRRDFEAALAELDEMLTRFPDHPWAAQARQKREALHKTLSQVAN